jgi:hypothetical protein
MKKLQELFFQMFRIGTEIFISANRVYPKKDYLNSAA